MFLNKAQMIPVLVSIFLLLLGTFACGDTEPKTSTASLERGKNGLPLRCFMHQEI